MNTFNFLIHIYRVDEKYASAPYIIKVRTFLETPTFYEFKSWLIPEVTLQGDNEVAGQAFQALWAKRTRILKKCKYVSKDIYLSFKNVKMIFMSDKRVRN